MDSFDIATLYGYIPTKYVAIIFLVLFCVTTSVLLWQLSRSAMFVWPLVVCGLLEIMGWAARLASSLHPERETAYGIQLVVLLFGPTPLAHGIFGLLDSLNISFVNTILCKTGYFSNAMYYFGLSSMTTAAVIIQVAGGAIAAVAFHHGKDPSRGGEMMLAGIIVHLVIVVAHLTHSTYFFLRNYGEENGSRSPTGLRSPYLSFTVFNIGVALLLARIGYRIAELSGGFNGKLATTELYFSILDGTMVLLALVLATLVLPGTINYLRSEMGLK